MSFLLCCLERPIKEQDTVPVRPPPESKETNNSVETPGTIQALEQLPTSDTMAANNEATWGANFDAADKDKNGFLTIQELRDMMKKNNSGLTDSECIEIFVNISTGGDRAQLATAICDPENTVTKQKYIAGMKKLAKDAEKADKLFSNFDKDGSGSLDKFEVMNLIKAAKGCDDTKARVMAGEIFDNKDINGDGKLSKQEIISCLQ